MSKIVYDQILDIVVALSLFERVLTNCTVKHPVLEAKDERKWTMKKTDIQGKSPKVLGVKPQRNLVQSGI